MTRKCVLCKETNYKNTYSFFSAPKDPELRKKWEEAIAIDNYSVSDDTYVCSRHFDRKDIITHWVSGIPPHVITIKYKKCRLRPGAIPSRKYDNDMDKDTDNECDLALRSGKSVYQNSKRDQDRATEEENENFLIPREDRADSNTDTENYEILDNFQVKHETNDHTSTMHFRKNSDSFTSLTNYDSYMDDKEYGHTDTECETVSKDQSKYRRKISDQQQEESDHSMEVYVDNGADGDVYIKNDMSDEISESEFLFEDLLEVYTDVVLPRGWSCLVTSKGHATTIVYLYMGMTKKGMPFVEKQVYLKSDMILHCSINDREINPIIHNLVREGKHLKVRSLMDIEELIDEFNQRTICEGLASSEDVEEISAAKVAYKDTKWRHVLCPLIVNNGSTKCSKCTTLSNVLAPKSKESFSVPYNSNIFLKKRAKAQKLQQAKRRNKKRNRRYEFMKTCKN